METNEVIIILSLASTLGIMVVALAAITATYRSLPQWAQGLVSSASTFVLDEVDDLTKSTENTVDDELAKLIRREIMKVLQPVETVANDVKVTVTENDNVTFAPGSEAASNLDDLMEGTPDAA